MAQEKDRPTSVGLTVSPPWEHGHMCVCFLTFEDRDLYSTEGERVRITNQNDPLYDSVPFTRFLVE